MGLTPSPLDDSGPIREAARSLFGTFQGVAETAAGISNTWAGLHSSYSAPDDAIVLNAMIKPDNYARTVEGHAETMYNALVAYAARLDELKKVRDQLIADIAAHEQKLSEAENATCERTWGRDKDGYVPTTKENCVSRELVAEGDALTERVEQFQTDLENAQRECGNKLNATWGGPQFVQSDKTNVNNPYVYGSSMDSKRDQTRTGQMPWGAPEAWKKANSDAQTQLMLGGAWRSIIGNLKDLGDLVGINGDEGATEYKRSGLLKLGQDGMTFLGGLLPEEIMRRKDDPEAQERFNKSAESMLNLLKGITSYDTWDTDPHGTFGGLLPDAASIAFGGGMGKLGLKILTKIAPGLGLKVTELLRIFNLRNLGNLPKELQDLFRGARNGSPGLQELQEIVEKGSRGAHAPGDTEVPNTTPHKNPGPIEDKTSGGKQPRLQVYPEGHVNEPSKKIPVSEDRIEPRRGVPEHHDDTSRHVGGQEHTSRHVAGDEQHYRVPGGRGELGGVGREVGDGGHRVPEDGASLGRGSESEGRAPGLGGSESRLVESQDGTSLSSDSKASRYDSDASVRETIPAREAPRRYTQEDVQRALDGAPRNEYGQPVDHRNGRPLVLTDAAGHRGWVMRYDVDADAWIPENRSLHEGGLPAKGEPNSFGYDENGDLLPYANDRPKYTEKQIREVWDRSRKELLEQIRSGDVDLPEPGENQIWVKTVDDAQVGKYDGGEVRVDPVSGDKWRKIEWDPAQGGPRDWDMGHIKEGKYSELRRQYLSGEISKDTFLEKYRDSKKYRVEDPARNRAHVDE